MHSTADKSDLDFLEQESGVSRAHEEKMQNQKHERNMESKEFDRLANLDSKAFDSLNKPN